MRTLGTFAHFEVGGIECSADALGTMLEVERGEIRLRIELPTTADEFKFPYATVSVEDSHEHAGRPKSLVAHPDGRTTIELVRVLAMTDVEDSWDEGDPDLGEEAVRSRLLAAAAAAASDFFGWTRVVVQQDSLDPAHGELQPTGGYALFELLESGEWRSFATMVVAGTSFRLLAADRPVLNRDSLSQIVSAMQRAGSPPPEELLLADAAHLVHYGERGADPSVAVLLAAIAVEVRTKRVLNAIASEEQQALLALLTENPRDWSLSAHATLMKALPAVRQVQIDDDLAALNKPVQDLFTARNDVAHRGRSLNRDDATRHVEAARQVFDYLAAIGT